MDIKGDWKKRAVCGLMVLAMALSLLPTSILAADTRSVTDNAIKNGSFEEPAFHDKNSPQWPANNVPDWDTTASDQLIEFGSRRNGKDAPQLTGVDKTIPDGSQFAELNADEESTLYQYATTVGGNVYEWGLSHRGRDGVDHMALIIGPKQNFDPAKPSEDGRDQFMRMTDWVSQHESNLKVDIPPTGCTQKITVYSKKFAKNGGFENDFGDAFSASASDVYTEKWNVWIIGTSNTAWGNYGTKSSAYAAGNLAYSCRYAVPDGQTKTVFAFCSYSAATSDKTLGNLIDNIHFSLYQTITAAATAGGSGFIGVPTGDKRSVYYEIGSSMSELVVANGSTIKVKAVEPESGDVQFVGAYVTRQTAKGLEQVFIPVTDKEEWGEEGDTYTYEHRVEEPADIVLVFVKKPMVIYEANGGEYTHGDNGTNAVSFAQQAGSGGVLTPRGPYTAQAAETTKDGWRFDGWLLPQNNNKVLPAVHTVSYDAESETFTFTANGETTELESVGATLIAQWKWRQRFVTASRVKDENGKVSADFRENTDCGTVEIVGNVGESVANNPAAKDYFASASERVTVTAAANAGYEFMGWYQQVDGNKYELVSSEPTHSYNVSREGVQTVYARFAPTHTVTYQWASVDAGKCPPNKPKLPNPGTVIDGGTYYISKDFIKDKTTIDGTVTKDGRTVPGKWVFTGWHDGKEDGSSGNDVDIVIRETELIKVTGDRTLTGFWTFIPEKEHTLTYQFADNTRWSPSGSFAQTEEHYRGESVKAASEPARNQTTDEEGNPIDVLATGKVTLYGDWSFKGWQRSDTKDKDIVAAGDGFDMPGNDLTLTGQWEFTPYTYTVVYDLGNGTTVADPNNENYNYSKLLGSDKSGLNAPSTGIPFGASIELMEFPAGTEIPNDKYFAGWSLVKPENNLSTIETQAPGDSVGFRKLKVTENGQEVKLYAVYKNKDVATVDFAVNNSNWGDVNPKSGSFTVRGSTVDEKTVSSTATPREGYHFVGWYEKKSDGGLTEVKDENGNWITDAKLTVTSDMMQEKLNSLTEKLVVHYVAVFARDSFTVKFDPNVALDAEGKSDVTGEMPPQKFPAPDSEDQLTTLRKNEFKRRGYVFTGWAESKTGEGRTYADKEPFAEVTIYQGNKIVDGGTITLYAQWKKLPDVTIFYTPEPTSLGTVELNPTESNELDPQDGMVSESLNPETGTAQGATAVPGEGSVFVGWYDAQDTERENSLTDSMIYTPEKNSSSKRYQDGSYVALFRLKQYVLHYDANAADAAGTMEDQTFPHGQAYPLKECAFSREGYRFVGWATESTGKAKYEDQRSIKLDEEFPNLKDDNDEATLYAVWHEQSVTLSYEPNDAELGSVSKASETVDAVTGTAKGSTAQPKSGARFDGWYSADGALLSKELTFVPTKKDGAVWQGTTYYAHFSAKRSPSTPSTPAKPDETKPTLAPIPEMLNGEDHYAYLLGYEDGTVRPNGSISRAEVATVLFRLLKDDVRMQNLTKDNAYSDVSDTAWYAAAVSTLSKMGVISGYPDGTFRPNAPITRAEFAAMIARFDETAKSADTPFTDISGHWAENAIGKAYGNGWVEGSSKTVFCPESNLTRAETATLLNRVLHRLPEKESDLLANQIVWPDNPETFWGYLAIQEATNSHEYERKADGVHETQTAKRENRDWSKEFEQ